MKNLSISDLIALHEYCIAKENESINSSIEERLAIAGKYATKSMRIVEEIELRLNSL